MKRQWLFILLLVASALLLRLQIYTEQQREGDKETAGQLTTIDPERIMNIRIQRPSDTLLFSKQAEVWVMTQPESGLANPERITELRALAILDVLSSYDAKNMDLSALELAPPKLSVWLNDTRIDFGKLNPANQRRYVLAEERLNLIADNIYPILSLPADAFIQKNPATQNNNVQ
jgi:hypothetical protein